VKRDLSTEKGENSQQIKQQRTSGINPDATKRRATAEGCPYELLSEANPANGGTHYEKHRLRAKALRYKRVRQECLTYMETSPFPLLRKERE